MTTCMQTLQPKTLGGKAHVGWPSAQFHVLMQVAVLERGAVLKRCC